MGVDFVMTHYKQRDNIDTTQLDDEWIILDAAEFTVTKLNGMGGYCWALLKDKQTVESIIQSITEEFNNNHSVEASDIEQFLDMLIEYGLLIHAV